MGPVKDVVSGYYTVANFQGPSDSHTSIHQVALHRSTSKDVFPLAAKYSRRFRDCYIMPGLWSCPSRFPPPSSLLLYLLCQLCPRIWLQGLAYIEACRADSKLAGRVANDCLAPPRVWWQGVGGISLKVTGTLPEDSLWLEQFAPNLGPDKRCFCLRLNSSPDVRKGINYSLSKNGLTLDCRSCLTARGLVPVSIAAVRFRGCGKQQLIVKLAQQTAIIFLFCFFAAIDPLPAEESLSL